MKKTNKKSGISLIVLVITIIVIIVLAVAVILTLANNNPIENAKQAVSANDEAALKEEATLLYADWYLLKNIPNGTGTDLTAQEYVISKLKGDYSAELKSRLSVLDTGEITIGTKEDSINAKKWTWTDNQEEGIEGHGEISVGDLVTYKEKTTEQFYVIKKEGDNVAMLAAKNITTTGTLVQSDSAPTVAFSNTKYWLSETSYPLDLNEYTDKTDAEKTNMGVVSTDAIEIARAYGATFDVEGRLMRVEEVVDLGGSMSDESTSDCPSFINTQNYWLGSARFDSYVCVVDGGISDLLNYYFDVDDFYGVRPVLEISASSIE